LLINLINIGLVGGPFAAVGGYSGAPVRAIASSQRSFAAAAAERDLGGQRFDQTAGKLKA